MQFERVTYKDMERVPQLSIPCEFKSSFVGSAPAPFIGQYGYPTVNVGILSPQFVGALADYDSPRLWNATSASIGSVASKRYEMVNSRVQSGVKDFGGRFTQIVQEVAMAKMPAELEINLLAKPELSLKLEDGITPFGPGAGVKSAAVTSNVRVDRAVEKVVGDTDLRAREGVLQLYKRGFEESVMNKILSVGALGVGRDRKLVPTRWSITAVDDTVGKELLDAIRGFSVGGCTVYFGGGWGNYYLVLMFDRPFAYELFEVYVESDVNPWSSQGLKYSTDFEGYTGRTTYATETAGGYYACRLSVLEELHRLTSQNGVLVLRFITPEYSVPLGVWVCREATRNALGAGGERFESREEVLVHALTFVQKRFGINISTLLASSLLLKEPVQKDLRQFL